MTRPSGKPIGIKDIARSLGVSIGTVDRALHGRAGIKPETRARVLKAAETMGYRPNLAARYLKSGKQLRISVQLPREIAFFFDAIRQGIRDAAGPFQPALQLIFRDHPRLAEGDLVLFDEALADRTSGIIVAPGHPAEAEPYIRKAANAGIPVVCVATDAPGSERLTAITPDAFINGAIVGELLSRFMGGTGRVAVITGDLSTVDHAEKLNGFRHSLAAVGSNLEVAAVVEAHDDEHEAYRQTQALLACRPGFGGIYVSTANSLPVLQAIEESGQSGSIAVITTDLFSDLVPFLRDRKVLATIHQRPLTQGRMAFEALYRFLAEKVTPAPRVRLAPHIVMASNLELFLDHARAETERNETALVAGREVP